MQNDQILVMNRSWLPIAVTTVKRGMSLVFRGHARVVDEESYQIHTWESWLSQHAEPKTPADDNEAGFIQTVSLKIRLPRVITLGHFNGVPSQQLAYSRRALFRRDNYQCQYCGCQPGVKQLTIDHVMPRSRGGPTDWLNCVIACVRCNVRKSNRTPEECGQPLKRKPFKPNWLDGFKNPDGSLPDVWAKFVKH